jgi:SAM-dependent methyltransferase
MSLSTDYDRWHDDRAGSSASNAAGTNSPWYRLVREYLVSVQGKQLLEIACGCGGFTTSLALLGGHVVGADFSRSAVKLTQRELAARDRGNLRASVTQADAEKLPFVNGSFDVVFSCETIEHLPDPLSALAEMARVCRPGGLLYLTTPNYFNLMGLYRLYDRMRGRPQRSEESQPYDTVWNFLEVRQLVRKAGWKILRTDGTVHQLPFPGRPPVTIHVIEKNRLLRRTLSVFALHQFVLAQKKVP